MRVIGAVAVILGGLVAAVTGPLELSKGSWAAAYLVLVVGAAQVMMGSARQHWSRSGADAPDWTQLALWNIGNIAVIAGTVAGSTIAVILGAAALAVALVLAFLATFRVAERRQRLLMLCYRILLVLLAVSIPIGVTLSAIRNA